MILQPFNPLATGTWLVKVYNSTVTRITTSKVQYWNCDLSYLFVQFNRENLLSSICGCLAQHCLSLDTHGSTLHHTTHSTHSLVCQCTSIEMMIYIFHFKKWLVNTLLHHVMISHAAGWRIFIRGIDGAYKYYLLHYIHIFLTNILMLMTTEGYLATDSPTCS